MSGRPHHTQPFWLELWDWAAGSACGKWHGYRPALQIDEIPRANGTEHQFHIRARSFLHNQVRSFVGPLERVGSGAWAPDDVAAAFKGKDRAACGPVCPPQGLYLAQVLYPTDHFA